MLKNKKGVRFIEICVLGLDISNLKRLMIGSMLIGLLAAIFGARILNLNNEALFQFILFLSLIQTVIMVTASIACFAGRYSKKYREAILAFASILPAPLSGTCLSAQLAAWTISGFSTTDISAMSSLAASLLVTLFLTFIAWETIEEIKDWILEIILETDKGENT